ncbi:hypothetical protein KJ693_00800 [bacterium]|nr:hypothetical protein [bacterium]MBU1613828.1 hypothetical protein [bacterium]
MGRIRRYVEVGEHKYWTLFDTGARNTYVAKEVSLNLPTFDLPEVNPVSLGGKLHNVVKYSNLTCKVEGYHVLAHARVLDEIGRDEDGKKIEVLMGALTMQEWGIIPVPEKESLDMSHYPKEFVEF